MARHSNGKASKGAIKKSRKKKSTSRRNATAKRAARKVTGTVLKIVSGKPTDARLSAEEAFSDPQQAVEQVLYAERHGSREELRLVRLAYRQYQEKRFRMK